MKRCTYCGRDSDDDAMYCLGCGTAGFRPAKPAHQTSTNRAPPPPPTMQGEDHTDEQGRAAFVTLTKCGRLWEADLIKSRLESAGIQAIIPDEFLMQVICWNLNTYGFVRLEVPTADEVAARDLLATMRGTPEVLYESRL